MPKASKAWKDLELLAGSAAYDLGRHPPRHVSALRARDTARRRQLREIRVPVVR